MRLTKNVKNILTITVLAVLLYAASYFIVGTTFVPQNFTEARANSAKTAGELMAILNVSQANLVQIAQYDKDYQFIKALDLVKQELENIRQSFEKSTTLATQLNDMSNAATGITPIKARNLAIDAMRQEVSLVGKLIIYNQSFGSLLENLQLKFSGSVKYNSDDVQKQIEIMNSVGKEINELNELYNQKMTEFDKLTAK